VSQPAHGRGAAAAPVVQVPVDLVELETRLAQLERRLSEQEARDQVLIEVAQGMRRLTEALGPLLEVIGSVPESDHHAGALVRASPEAARGMPPERSPGAVDPERLAHAQARMRAAAAPEQPAPPRWSTVESAAPAPPPGRRSWLWRALRRMAGQNPEAAGRLLLALRPAHRLALIEPVGELPGPPATVARVVVRGRLGRRLGWEMAQLHCELAEVSTLAELVRMRASPAQLHAAGVRLDPTVTLALVGLAIDRRWTLGHSFTLAHHDTSDAYLEVRNGARPAVRTDRPERGVTTKVVCPGDSLLPLLAGASGDDATIEGERRPFELVRGWFADATTA
jgi:hypothetical protein